jgi:hypothetical protein
VLLLVVVVVGTFPRGALTTAGDDAAAFVFVAFRFPIILNFGKPGIVFLLGSTLFAKVSLQIYKYE